MGFKIDGLLGTVTKVKTYDGRTYEIGKENVSEIEYRGSCDGYIRISFKDSICPLSLYDGIKSIKVEFD